MATPSYPFDCAAYVAGHHLAAARGNRLTSAPAAGSTRQTSEFVDRLLVLDADSPVHLRDRGSVLVRMRRLHEGAAAWDRYLRRFPSAQDAETFREQLRKVRQKLGALN